MNRALTTLLKFALLWALLLIFNQLVFEGGDFSLSSLTFSLPHTFIFTLVLMGIFHYVRHILKTKRHAPASSEEESREAWERELTARFERDFGATADPAGGSSSSPFSACSSLKALFRPLFKVRTRHDGSAQEKAAPAPQDSEKPERHTVTVTPEQLRPIRETIRQRVPREAAPQAGAATAGAEPALKAPAPHRAEPYASSEVPSPAAAKEAAFGAPAPSLQALWQGMASEGIVEDGFKVIPMIVLSKALSEGAGGYEVVALTIEQGYLLRLIPSPERRYYTASELATGNSEHPEVKVLDLIGVPVSGARHVPLQPEDILTFKGEKWRYVKAMSVTELIHLIVSRDRSLVNRYLSLLGSRESYVRASARPPRGFDHSLELAVLSRLEFKDPRHTRLSFLYQNEPYRDFKVRAPGSSSPEDNLPLALALCALSPVSDVRGHYGKSILSLLPLDEAAREAVRPFCYGL